jgi:hypothetical protein
MNTGLQAQTKVALKSSFAPVRTGLLQRKCACSGTPGPSGECAECREKRLLRRSTGQAEPSTAPAIVHDVLRSPGEPLDSATRAFMEPRFGHDFSRVRVHTDAKAAESARAVNALAYTVDQTIVFAAQQYRSGTTPVGDVLLAHELAHVVQGQRDSTGTTLAIASPDHPAERAADDTARAVTRGQPVTAASEATEAMLFRVPPDWEDPGTRRMLREIEKQERAKAREDALALAEGLETTYPGWRDVLPNCPCTVGTARGSTRWEEDNYLKRLLILPFFHPGSATAFRSAQGFASKPGTSHGQQCTFDELGNLITEGPAAGTPDVWSPVTHFSEHQDIDVKPFNVLGWQTYNQYWIPNKGDSCSSNRGEKRKAECEPEYLGMGAYLGADCIIRQGPGPKI